MRKIIFLLSALLSALLFYSGFQQIRSLETAYYTNITEAVFNEIDPSIIQDRASKIYIIPLSEERPYEETARKLAEIVSESNLTAIIRLEPHGNSDETQFVHYLSIPDGIHLSSIYTIEGIPEGFFQTPDGLISSSTSNQARSATLDFTDNSLHDPWETEFIIRPFCDLPSFTYADNTQPELGIWVAAAGEGVEVIKNTFENLGYSVEEGEPNLSVIFSPRAIQIDYDEMLCLILAVFCALLLSVLCFVFKERKEFAIRTLQGQSRWRIFKEMILPLSLMSIAAYALTAVLAYWIVVGHVRPVDTPFLQYLWKMFLVFTGLAAVVSCVSWVLLSRMQSTLVLKEKNILENSYSMAVGFKTVVLCILVPVLCGYFNDGMTHANTLMDCFRFKDSFTENLVNTFSPSSLSDEYLAFFNQHDGIFACFDLESHDMNGNPSFLDYPIRPGQSQILYNDAYFDKHPVYGPDHEILQLPDAEVSVLVPEKYYQDFITKSAFISEQGWPVLAIENGQTFINTRAYDSADEMLRTDPFIIVYKNWSPLTSAVWGIWCLSIPDTPEVRAQIDQLRSEQDLDTGWTSNRLYYNRVLRQLKTFIIRNVCSILLVLFMILIFQYFDCFLFFYENGDEVALQFLLGKSFREKYRTLFIWQSLAFAGAAVFFLFTHFFRFWEMLLWLCILLGLNLLLCCLFIRHFEKKQIVSALKGDA